MVLLDIILAVGIVLNILDYVTTYKGLTRKQGGIVESNWFVAKVMHYCGITLGLLIVKGGVTVALVWLWSIPSLLGLCIVVASYTFIVGNNFIVLNARRG